MVSPLDYFLLSFLEREESKFGRGTRLSTGSSCLWLEHDCSVPELCSPSLHGPESRPRGWASPLINVDGQSSEMRLLCSNSTIDAVIKATIVSLEDCCGGFSLIYIELLRVLARCSVLWSQSEFFKI